MRRLSYSLRWLSVAVIAATSACNMVLGNEDGVLDQEDGGAVEEPLPDRAVPETGATEPDTSSESSTSEPDVSVSPPDAPAPPSADVGPDTIREAEPHNEASASDADLKDAPKLVDRVEDVRRDVVDASTCDAGVSMCAPGQSGNDMQTCGPCGRGTQTRTRTCLADGCGWGPWSAWSACSVTTAECMPGQTSSDSQACGPCNTGTQTRTRSCTASCTWGAWGAFGACGNVTAECLPDHWRCCGAGKWEWCYQNTCKWTGGCAPCNDPSCTC